MKEEEGSNEYAIFRAPTTQRKAQRSGFTLEKEEQGNIAAVFATPGGNKAV